MTVLAADIPCRQCSYNLRGLPAAALCPECATPVAHSLRSDLLCFAHADWLRTLARGSALFRAGTAVTAAYAAWVLFARRIQFPLGDIWPISIIAQAVTVAGVWSL